ncbi:hypothetical protein MMC21_007221 [Puttea exsequens]|nr:hypothetical protein [Puttea exsequens]
MTPPQPSIPPVATILGTVSTVLWCVQLIPQIWQNWRRKSTEGVPSWMMFLWALCAPPYGVYAIVQDFNIPVQMQPQIFTFLTLIAWSQTLIYSHRWATWKATAAGIGVGALLGGIEVMLVFCFRIVYRRGINAPVVAIGVLAVVLQSAGFIPLYYDIFKRKGRVIGINFIFLAIDSLGAVFGLASLVVQPEFDALGISDFIAILVGEGVVFLAQPLWLYRTRATRRKARSAGQTYDEYVSHLETPEETEREPESVESPISPGSIAVGFEKVLETV